MTPHQAMTGHIISMFSRKNMKNMSHNHTQMTPSYLDLHLFLCWYTGQIGGGGGGVGGGRGEVGDTLLWLPFTG